MAKSIKYDPSWESLDKRPIPGWFLDSKFGAFIMWGDYSVPAFADENSYSEFYEYFLKADEKMIESETYGNISFKNQDTEFTPESLGQYIRKNSAIVKDFHYRTYGKDFRYENFLDIFKAELFDPVLWAEIFSKAGIKYIIAAAKHHGGYCMFPSEHEAKSWGYYKDSVHIGPKRDLLGEIFDAMRGKNIKPGIYYSMYEWLNPLWLTDRGLFVEQVTVPQIKDIVIRYEPLNIWNDGDWLMGYKDWRSEEILAWLFNESPVASEIVVNNRWGGDDRLHGSYYTTECGGGFKDAAHPWEETHGIDSSFGYKRNSTYFEHKSAKRLIHTLVDIVSRGGNYLLAIPPRADGRIPNLIVERLTQIGSWLDVNGEAIYGTRPYKKSYQWNDNKEFEIDYGKSLSFGTGGFDITEFTEKNRIKDHPIIEAFFTSKSNTVYVILPNWPGKKFILRDFSLSGDIEIKFLGLKGNLNYKKNGNNIIIEIPDINVDEVPCNYAYTIKIKEKI